MWVLPALPERRKHPPNFELYNEATVFQGSSVMLCRNLYHSLPKPQCAAACAVRPAAHCEELCPQNLEIRQLLTDVRNKGVWGELLVVSC